MDKEEKSVKVMVIWSCKLAGGRRNKEEEIETGVSLNEGKKNWENDGSKQTRSGKGSMQASE